MKGAFKANDEVTVHLSKGRPISGPSLHSWAHPAWIKNPLKSADWNALGYRAKYLPARWNKTKCFLDSRGCGIGLNSPSFRGNQQRPPRGSYLKREDRGGGDIAGQPIPIAIPHPIP